MADIEWLGAHAQEVYNVVAHFQDHVGPDHALFGPATHFLTALDQEFDCAEFRGEPGLSLKAMTGKLQYAQRKRSEAEQRLEKELSIRTGLRTQTLWWIRCGLSDPSIPSASLSSFTKEFFADDKTTGVSSYTVTRARDAFCQVLKHLDRKCLKTSATLLEPKERGVPPSVIIVHIHDEAVMRAKSWHQGMSYSSTRSRSSSVQNQILRAHLGQESIEVLTELVGLAKKNVGSVASSLIAAAKDVIGNVLEGLKANSFGVRQLRVVHLLVGDGAAVNGAAGKKVYADLSGLADDVVSYRMMMWHCAAHQSNLVAQWAICQQSPPRRNELVGTCVRLFKYIMNFYHDDFHRNLASHISASLQVVALESADILAESCTLKLRELYGPAVIPDDVAQALNHCVTQLVHREHDRQRDRSSLCQMVARILCQSLLVVHDKPVTSRFFVFAESVNCLLRMKLLNLGPDVWLRLPGRSPGKENSKRIDRVRAFFESGASDHALRQASLCLQLSSHVMHACSQKPKGDETPMLVRLGRGDVQKKAGRDVASLLQRLDNDPVLDRSSTAIALLGTAAQIIMRFDVFLQFPTKIYTLSKQLGRNALVSSLGSFEGVDGCRRVNPLTAPNGRFLHGLCGCRRVNPLTARTWVLRAVAMTISFTGCVGVGG